MLAATTVLACGVPTIASAHTSGWCGHSSTVFQTWYLYYGSYFNKKVVGGYYHYHRVGHHTYPGMVWLHSQNHSCGYTGAPGLAASATSARRYVVLTEGGANLLAAFASSGRLAARPARRRPGGTCETARWVDRNGARTVVELAPRRLAQRLGHGC